MLIIGAYPILEGIRHRVRAGLLIKMAFRLVLDWLIGLIPLVDIVFDVGYKANARNARDLADALND